MMNPSNHSSPLKFDMRVNPAYQIDWSTTAAGKRVAATKRRVSFRFGFSNRDALAEGMSGNEARGEEHNVGLIWSLTSGKRVVTYDGKEVHFSMGRRGDSKFETSWPIGGGHLLTIVAHATTPLRSVPGLQQFDLLFDGISFFSLPRIFELGNHRGPMAHAVQPEAHEHAFARKSIRQEEARRRSSAVDVSGEVRSMSSYPSLGLDATASQEFSGPVRRATLEVMPAASTAPAPLVVVETQDVLSKPTPAASLYESPQSSLTTPTVDEFAPVEPQVQTPAFQQVSDQILSAYSPAPTTSAPAPVTQYQTQTLVQVQTTFAPYSQQQPTYQPQPAMVSPDASAASSNGGFMGYPQEPALVVDPQASSSPAAAPVITPANKMTMMKPLELDELRDSPPPVDAMDQAVYDLVNLNNITETRAPPEQIKAKQKREVQQSLECKSRPKAPVATDWYVGKGASLADIQKHKLPYAPPSKEVMKVHAFDPAAAQAGMMVLYGQQQQSSMHSAGRMYHQGYHQPVRSAF